MNAATSKPASGVGRKRTTVGAAVPKLRLVDPNTYPAPGQLASREKCFRSIKLGSQAKDKPGTKGDRRKERRGRGLKGATAGAKPAASLERLIRDTPEVRTEFDVPDYILLDARKFDEARIESDLISKYIFPVYDARGRYVNDHDYLAAPLNVRRAEVDEEGNYVVDHDYMGADVPACHPVDRKLFCNICGRNNPNIFRFNLHMMDHTRRNDVTCRLCRETFLTTTCLNGHMEAHVTVCEVCGLRVPQTQLALHQSKKVSLVSRDSNRRECCCATCFKIFKDEGGYVSHLKTHVRYDCAFCGASFPGTDAYLRHLQVHGKVRLLLPKPDAGQTLKTAQRGGGFG